MSANDHSSIDAVEYFEFSAECLVEGVRVTFDCFLRPDKSPKILHWIRAGGLFRPDHAEKLRKLGKNAVLVPTYQKKQIAAYVEGLPAPQRARVAEILRRGPLDMGTQENAERSRYGGIMAVDARDGQIFGMLKTPDTIMVSGARGGAGSAQASRAGGKVSTTPRVDVSFLNPFIMATQQAFTDICQTQIQFSAPISRMQKGAQVMKIQVAAFISLVSQSIRGSIGLCFPEETYLATISKVAGRRVTTVDSEIVVGSGELINYIFEIARPNLLDKGFSLEQAVPVFVAGDDLSLPHLIPDPGFSIVFESEHGPFQFEVGIKTAT